MTKIVATFNKKEFFNNFFPGNHNKNVVDIENSNFNIVDGNIEVVLIYREIGPTPIYYNAGIQENLEKNKYQL